jgi:isopentenyldiphosphate isomerase
LKFFKIKKCKENKEYFYIYFLKVDTDIKNLSLQDKEVAEIKFISIRKLERELKIYPEKIVHK